MRAEERTEVCVVGAGPAGAVLAAALADRGHEVSILDAGPRFDPADRVERMERELRPAFTRSDVWDMGGDRDAFSSSGDVAYPLNETRVKGIGGTSLHWKGMVPRLHPEDFEMASRHGSGEDWPISYADLEPYYCAAEQAIGVAGSPDPFGGYRSEPYPLPAHPPSHADRLIEPALDTVGLELHACPVAINSEPYDDRGECDGWGVCNPVCPSGAKYSADVHVAKAQAAGARVLDRARVRRLETEADGTRVAHAVFRRDGDTRRIGADRFVIAAGGVETARLLLLSANEDHPDGLANASDAVGRYFQEHLSIKLDGRIDAPTRQHLIGFDTGISAQFYGHDDGPTGSMLLIVDIQSGPSPLDVAVAQDPHLVTLRTEGSLADRDRWGDALGDRLRSAYGHRVGVVMQTEQLPHRDDRVRLDRSKTDDLGDPVPDISLAVRRESRETLRRAQSVLYDVFDALEADDVRPVGSPERPYFNNHHMGTTRMGTDPATSVVDPALRAHGVDNLYVCSSGVFVTSGAVPPTLTIVALSLRLAAHLHDELS